MEEKLKKWHEKRRSLGLCRQCSNNLNSKSRTYCLSCSEKFTAKALKRQNNLTKRGLCVQCMNESEDRTCQSCKDKNNAVRRKKANDRQNLNLCIRCGHYQPVEKNRYCHNCCLKHASSAHLKTNKKISLLQEIYDRQKGICPYSGKKITIGLNAELDHIKPRSKGGTNEISNLQWLDAEINAMKLNHTEEEFKNLIKIIYNHLFS